MSDQKYNLYGLAKDETEQYMESLLLSEATKAQCKQIEQRARQDGYHSFRIAAVDLSMPPDFAGSVQI